MQYLIRDGDLAIRLMRDDTADYDVLAKWLTDPRVLEFYEGRDSPLPLDKIEEKYAPRIVGEENVTPCLVTLDSAPIGYIQFYSITGETRLEYDLPPESDITGIYATDQFIGEVECWNRGIGTRIVSLFLRYLFRQKHARKVIVDPHVQNARAIRCYEKCGFRKVKLLPAHEPHEGTYRDSWLMEVTPDESKSDATDCSH